MNENQWSDQEGFEKTDWKGKNEKKLASLLNRIPKWNLTCENLLEPLPNQIEVPDKSLFPDIDNDSIICHAVSLTISI